MGIFLRSIKINRSIMQLRPEIRLAFQRADIRGLTPTAPAKLYDIRSEVQDDVIEVFNIIWIFFVFLRVSFLLFHNIIIFGVLPAELWLLDWYLSQPDQDPVQFVREGLETSPPQEFEKRFRSFINIELCSSTREQIISLYNIICYAMVARIRFYLFQLTSSILFFVSNSKNMNSIIELSVVFKKVWAKTAMNLLQT